MYRLNYTGKIVAFSKAMPAGVIRWGDLPVPYIAAWTSESAIRVARDALCGNRPAIFRGGKRGEGRPIFGNTDERRSRRVVIKQLCQVCSNDLRGDGYVCDVPYAYMSGRPVVKEPAACEACFRTTLALCPGIRRLLANPRVLLARVRRYDPVAVTVRRAEQGDADMNAALDAWKGTGDVIGYVRPALTDYEILDRRVLFSEQNGDPLPSSSAEDSTP